MSAPENYCGEQAKRYYQCRRERDAQIFTAIKIWETEKVRSMKKEEQLKYIESLKLKKQLFEK